MESFVWFNSSLSVLVEAVLYSDGSAERSIHSVNDEDNISTPKSEWEEVPLFVMEALLVDMGMPLNEEPSDTPEDINFKFYVGLCLCQLTIAGGVVSFSVNGSFTINENIPKEWRKRIVLKAVKMFRSYVLTLEHGVELTCTAYHLDGNGGRRKDFYESLGFTCVNNPDSKYHMVYKVG